MTEFTCYQPEVFLGTEEEYLPEEWRSGTGFEPPSLQYTQCYSCGGLLTDFLALLDAEGTAAAAPPGVEANPLRIPPASQATGCELSFPVLPQCKTKGA